MSASATEDLYKRLVDAKLAGTRTPDQASFGEVASIHEYHFHSNEQAAELAVAVVLDWLDETQVRGS